MLFQYLHSLEQVGLVTRRPPCTFNVLAAIIEYFVKLPMSRLVAPTKTYPTLKDRWTKDWQVMLGYIISSLMKELQLQCPLCPKRLSTFHSVFWKRSIHLDHWTTYYKKTFAISRFTELPKAGGYVLGMLCEGAKIRGGRCSCCHEFGDAQHAYQSWMKQSLILQYSILTENAYPGVKHLTMT